ncbi:MAG: putative amidohydrolase YtcJ [Paracoccaceae bacterium]|jgi:predicted amidohydrolase YtcJ
MTLGQADDIWVNGKIATMDPHHPYAQALAVRDGRLLALGSDADIEHLSGPQTKRHNLGGKPVLPGFVESHTHALWGACRDLFDVFVGYRASFDQLLGAVQDRATTLEKGAFILGGPWHLAMRANMGPTPRETLTKSPPPTRLPYKT